MVDVGGANSIRSFSRSWARAAGFQEVIPQHPTFVFASEQEQAPMHSSEGIQYGHITDTEPGRGPRTNITDRNLLQQSLIPPSSSPGMGPSNVAPSNLASEEFPRLDQAEPLLNPLNDHRSQGLKIDSCERKTLESELSRALSPSGNLGSQHNIFTIPPYLASPPIVGSYSSFRSYGTMNSAVMKSSMAGAGPLWKLQQEIEAAAAMTDEPQSILVKEVEQDGKIVLAVEGQSTLPQTVFNSIKFVPPTSHHAYDSKKLQRLSSTKTASSSGLACSLFPLA